MSGKAMPPDAFARSVVAACNPESRTYRDENLAPEIIDSQAAQRENEEPYH
jgi:hypothetical protein